MPLSWTEIRHNAIRFASEWGQIIAERHHDLQGADHAAERALAQSFWSDFFSAFGIRKEVVRSFEVPVKLLSGSWGYIDLFWKRTLLVEHKTPGKSLTKAEQQANDYIQALVTHGRAEDVPRYVIVSDFLNFVLEDRREGTRLEIPLGALHQHIQAFSFLLPSLKQVTYEEQDPINLEAAEILGRLHDALKDNGYTGHELEQFLIRILFCLFAEDTGIFELKAFQLYLENHSREDGSDLGPRLGHLFEILNTPVEKRQKHLAEQLTEFPYVNGELFAERLLFADFNRAMRATLLECCEKDWSLISPAIFGSLFQSIMEAKERRQIGAHYTSERDILKVVRSLFLDDLRAEFDLRKADRSTARRTRLEEFHRKLASLRFLDPACGCGNFLVITYRELRLLEIEVLTLLHKREEQELDVRNLAQVDVHQFYGIEIEEWPARIAEVALWLMDHQMNIRLSKAFGGWYPRIPLKKSPPIHCANALRLDWREVLLPSDCSYVLGNPPFVGKHYQSPAQRADMAHVFQDFKHTGDLDYVVAWFYRAARYICATRVKVGFVATNSITQGEQVPIVWGLLFGQCRIKLHFAHRTFAWESEARGKAHVHVVIIGFANFDTASKRLYDYETDTPTVVTAANLSPYLTPGPDAFVTKRTKPLCDVPEMRCGNKPTDDGNFILTDVEKAALVKAEPGARKFLRRFTGSEEFINGHPRWCLWLEAATPAELDALPQVLERVRKVREFRQRSTAAPTQKAAGTPTLFFFRSQPAAKFIAIPEVSSERREYIPMGFLRPDVIVSNKIYVVASASLYHLGVLGSLMHMAWVKTVSGRLKSDFQYSGSMVYNTFPWPTAPVEKLRQAVVSAAEAVLAARAKFPDSTLAQLYHPAKMPPVLRKAHAALDRAVDRCYRKEPFTSERQRVEFLFALYEQLTAPLAAAMAAHARRKRSAYAQPPPGPPQPGITPEKSYADAAHFYCAKEESAPYRTTEPGGNG